MLFMIHFPVFYVTGHSLILKIFLVFRLFHSGLWDFSVLLNDFELNVH